MNNLHISSRNQLLHLIQKMITEEEKNNYVPINVENLILSLSKHVIQDPFIPKPLQTNEIKNIKRGICCSNCQNFILKFHKYYIECDCGLFESSEEAIVRTICEYGVLNYDQHMVRSNLLDFIDNQFSYSFLSKQLNRHFNRVNVGKPIVYENKRDTLDNLRSQFHFELPKNFYLNHEKYMLLVNRIQNSYII